MTDAPENNTPEYDDALDYEGNVSKRSEPSLEPLLILIGGTVLARYSGYVPGGHPSLNFHSMMLSVP
jgi:hypothetical protein